MKKLLAVVLMFAMMCCCSCADNGSKSNDVSSLDLSSLENNAASSQDYFSTVSQTDSDACFPPTYDFESATKAASHIFLAVCVYYQGDSSKDLPAGYDEYFFYPIHKYGNSDKGDLPKRSGQIEAGEYRNELIRVIVRKDLLTHGFTYADGDMCVLWLKYNEEKDWYQDIYPASKGLPAYELETQEELDARAEKFEEKNWQIGRDIKEALE
jgi:hypothetical protein